MGATLDRLARDRLLVSMLLVILICAAYFPGKPWISDSRWSIPTALSIVREGNLDLNEYGSLLDKYGNVDTQRVGREVYSRFPVGGPLLAVPFVFLLDRLTDIGAITEHDIPTGLEHFLASLCVAVTAVFVYLFSLELADRPYYAIAAALIFAFCTSAWSIAGLALWQHGPSMLMLSIALYLLLRARERPSLAQYASLPLAYSYVVRPTNAIPILLLTAYVAVQFRPYLWRYCLWSLPIAAPFAVLNLELYGSLLSPYYHGGDFSSGQIFTGLAGNLISPARGLLVYSPVLIGSVAGVVLKVRNRRFASLDYFLLAIIILHVLLISMIVPWYGGHSYGPRLFTDMLPFMIYFLIATINWLGSLPRESLVVALSAFLLLAGFSFFTQYKGAFSDPARDWNVHPDVDLHPGRIWDWSDVPFLRDDFNDRR